MGLDPKGFLQHTAFEPPMQFFRVLFALSQRNVILRYKHSLIGFLWGFLKPLLYLLIFIVIFSAGFASVKHYVLYATSGILLWFFFANIVSQSVPSIVQSGGILRSLKIEPLLLPLAEALTELFNLALALAVYFVLMQWFGMQYSWYLLWLLPGLLLFTLFSFAAGMLLSALHVYFRDVGILWTTLQPAFFYLTPVAYTEDLIPQRFAFLIRYNPIYAFIRMLRKPLLEALPPEPTQWMHCSLLTIGILIPAWLIFQRLKNQFITAL